MSELRRIPPEEAGRTGGLRLPVLDSGRRIHLLEGSYPCCTVMDPALSLFVGQRERHHCGHWEIVLSEQKSDSLAYLVLDYGCLQRTLVFSLAKHHRLLQHVWLDQRLAIYAQVGCPPVLVHHLPRAGLETLLGHAVLLGLQARIHPN